MRLNPLLYALNFDDWIYSRKVQSGKLTSSLEPCFDEIGI